MVSLSVPSLASDNYRRDQIDALDRDKSKEQAWFALELPKRAFGGKGLDCAVVEKLEGC